MNLLIISTTELVTVNSNYSSAVRSQN